MTNPAYKLLPRREARATPDLALALRRARLAALDPVVEVGRFHETILGLARGRQNALGNPTSESLTFALDTLLPFRQRGIERYLDRFAVDQRTLSAFLGHLRDLATAMILGSTDADSLAEAVTTMLDDLHAYLLAHRLLTDGYVESERALAQRLLHADQGRPPKRDDDEREPERADARDHELALAA